MGKKIAVIRFSSIGDLVLTTPVIRALRQQIGAEVHVITKKAFGSIMEVNPNVSKVHAFDGDISALIGTLKAENFDEIIDLHHNLRSRRIISALGIRRTSFHKLNFEKWLMVRFKINKLPNVHIVDRYMDTVKHLNVLKDGQGLDFFIPLDKTVDVKNVFGVQPLQYAVIVVGAAHQTKCLTVPQLQQLCNSLTMPVVLAGGKDEMQKADQILSGTTNPHVKNAVGQLNILQSASLIKQAGPIITPDTGMMHIAAAFKKPVIVVWGNTIPQFGMYPYYGDHLVNWMSFEQFLSCRPCSKLGFEKCPKGHFKCILQLDIKAIASAATNPTDLVS